VNPIDPPPANPSKAPSESKPVMENLSGFDQIRTDLTEHIDKALSGLKADGEHSKAELTTKLDELKSGVDALAGKMNAGESPKSRGIGFILAILLAAATAFFGAAAGAHFAGRDVAKNTKLAERAKTDALTYSKATTLLVTVEHGFQGFFVSSGSVDNKFELAAAELQELIDSNVLRGDGKALSQFNDYVMMKVASLRAAPKPWNKAETDKIQMEAFNLFLTAQKALEHWFESDRDK
jgi:hypothetical protein